MSVTNNPVRDENLAQYIRSLKQLIGIHNVSYSLVVRVGFFHKKLDSIVHNYCPKHERNLSINLFTAAGLDGPVQ